MAEYKPLKMKVQTEFDHGFEKPFYKSKKFIAFMIMEIFLAGLAVLALLTQRPLGWPLAAFMVADVLTMGAIAFGFIGRQADLDRYLRGMALNKLHPDNPGDTIPSEPEDEELIE